MGLKQNGAAMAQPKILLTRIDDRFIYGQDVELWNEAVGSNLVLIVNNEIAADSRKWAPMRVAAPEGVWTRFFSVQRTIDIMHTATPRQWILIMVASPADALALVKGGVPITKISNINSRFTIKAWVPLVNDPNTLVAGSNRCSFPTA